MVAAAAAATINPIATRRFEFPSPRLHMFRFEFCHCFVFGGARRYSLIALVSGFGWHFSSFVLCFFFFVLRHIYAIQVIWQRYTGRLSSVVLDGTQMANKVQKNLPSAAVVARKSTEWNATGNTIKRFKINSMAFCTVFVWRDMIAAGTWFGYMQLL